MIDREKIDESLFLSFSFGRDSIVWISRLEEVAWLSKGGGWRQFAFGNGVTSKLFEDWRV